MELFCNEEVLGLEQLIKAIIRELDEDIPLIAEPYKEIADKLNISQSELLYKIDYLVNEGIIRKIGALLNHQRAGFTSNAMVVWKVPEEILERIGASMASIAEVTHCYHRETSADWEYNIFTMIHGKTEEECEKVICKIILDTGINDYQVLYSLKELKKTSMKYFDE